GWRTRCSRPSPTGCARPPQRRSAAGGCGCPTRSKPAWWRARSSPGGGDEGRGASRADGDEPLGPGARGACRRRERTTAMSRPGQERAVPAGAVQARRAVVIGGGIAGLASAALLAEAGYQVDLLEKRADLGGRTGFWQSEGFRFDTGPSWLLMAEVFDHFFTQ